MKLKREKGAEGGQVLIILLLIVLVALTVGLALSQRTVSNLANSDSSDQSSRALAAAQAGIEQVTEENQTNPAPTSMPAAQSLSNQSSYKVTYNSVVTTPGEPLEYPEPIGKQTIAQFWLVDPSSTFNPVSLGTTYGGSYVDILFGNKDDTTTPAPAIEVNLVTYSGGVFKANRSFWDSDFTRTGAAGNGFADANSCTGVTTDTSYGSNRSFRCYARIDIPVGETPIILRVRLLYSPDNDPQVIALRPDPLYALPQQAVVYTSYGYSGNSIKKIQSFQIPYVVSSFMDFALFSGGGINK